MATINVVMPKPTLPPARRGVVARSEFVASREEFDTYLVGIWNGTWEPNTGLIGAIDQFSSQANALRVDVNNLRNQTETIKNQAVFETQSIIGQALLYANQANASSVFAQQSATQSAASALASQTAYNNTVQLLNNTDIAGTAGYTINAVDDLFEDLELQEFLDFYIN